MKLFHRKQETLPIPEPFTAADIRIEASICTSERTIGFYDRKTRRLRRANVKTMPYPGFPTDMQPQVGVCMALARGVSIISEGIYDTRFRYCAELNRMGASIQVDTKMAIVDGVEQLHGCTVKACDLHAGAAMVIAGLAADGVTTVEDAHYIERGYECFIDKLRALGADIRRIDAPDTHTKVEHAG